VPREIGFGESGFCMIAGRRRMFEFFTKPKSDKNGFTLIELLVVIAIIGTLSGMVLVAMTGVREKARDARRVSDIAQIRKALEMLYANKETYITTSEICSDFSTGCLDCGCGGENAHGYGNWSLTYSNLSRALVPEYMAKIPTDPINNSTYYYNFEPNSGGQGKCTGSSSKSCEFVLCAVRLEATGRAWCNDSFGVGVR